MSIKLTKAEALAIQAKQIAHYASLYPGIGVAEIVARHTHAELLDDGVEYDVVIVNRAIPRGAKIEFLIDRQQGNLD